MLPTEAFVELYWTMPLTYMRGVTVKVVRARTTVAVKRPWRRVTRLTERLGSTESCGVSSTRAALSAMDRRSPL
ncbi:MAG: hypothetical protein R2712_13915 [Vicinamibacterales bacterium]